MSTKQKTNFKLLAAMFDEECKKYGFGYSYTDSVITINQSYRPGDNAAYVAADMIAADILSIVPVTKSDSSVWGTTSDGIGGYSGLNGGYYRLNKSAPKKSFVKELRLLGKGY